MNLKFQMTSGEWPVARTNSQAAYLVTRHPSPVTHSARRAEVKQRRAFTLVEMLVTLALLSLIVLALMAVFNTTQNAFRSGLTETDILESGRLTMGLIADDLAETTPGYGFSSVSNSGSGLSANGEPFLIRGASNAVNFYVHAFPDGYFTVQHEPFVQYLPGTSAKRTNVLEDFFILSRRNVGGRPSWVGTGYAVDPLSWPTNSLYRFVMIGNVMKGNPWGIFTSFTNDVYSNILNQVGKQSSPFTNTTYWTHVMDGVMDLTVKPYDPYGLWMTNYWDKYNNTRSITNLNSYFYWPLFPYYPINASPGVSGCFMFSNAVPASVEVTLGVMENDTLQRAEGLPGPPSEAQINYVSNHVAQVHVFRQRVWIRNVDPTAYQ